MHHCLIIDSMHPSLLPMLSDLGIIADYQPNITRSEVLSIITKYEGIIVRSKIDLDAEFFNHATNLRYIARAGAGIDKIDVAIAEAKNIAVLNAPEGNSNAVGEHALGMLLSLLNKINSADKEVRQGVWKREANRGVELAGKTVGIVGYGHMGKSFARKLHALGCNVIAYDKYLSNYGDEYAQEVSLEVLCAISEVVSFHFPLASENKNIVNHAYLSQFANPIWLINTARGEILDTEALINGLKSGRILGAALDVLENERLERLSDVQQQQFQFLCQCTNVVLTPHVGGWTHESYVKINEVLASKIKQYL